MIMHVDCVMEGVRYIFTMQGQHGHEYQPVTGRRSIWVHTLINNAILTSRLRQNHGPEVVGWFYFIEIVGKRRFSVRETEVCDSQNCPHYQGWQRTTQRHQSNGEQICRKVFLPERGASYRQPLHFTKPIKSIYEISGRKVCQWCNHNHIRNSPKDEIANVYWKQTNRRKRAGPWGHWPKLL